MVRYKLIFKGRVQGVGFRYQIKILADKLKLSGDCKNLYNGDVEVHLQGHREKIEFLIHELNKDRYIIIDEIFKKEEALQNDDGFKVLY